MPSVDVTIRAIDQGSQNVQKFSTSLSGIATKAIAAGVSLGALKAALGGVEMKGRAGNVLGGAVVGITTTEATPKGAQSEEPGKWRYRSEAARVVVLFTDATFKETMSIPEAKGGALQDVANVVMANRIILSIFAPNFEVYDRLSQIDKSEWEVVEYEGLSAQEALQRYTSDQANFRNTLKQLAAQRHAAVSRHVSEVLGNVEVSDVQGDGHLDSVVVKDATTGELCVIPSSAAAGA